MNAPVRLTRADWVRPTVVLSIMLVVAVVYLRWQGRIWWCAQGDYTPFSLQTWSPHNSQHVFDAYSFSHVLHGVFFFAVLWFARRRLNWSNRFLIATALELGWELLENSPIIINRYREATVSLGYTGDSILNSMGDTASCALGFWLAGRLGLWRSIGLWIVIEAGLLLWIRDNLTLNVLMLIYPIDAIKQWQSAM
ncbi:MAG: DUF2585 family protein [Tepidisphaeraceae bacterium]